MQLICFINRKPSTTNGYNLPAPTHLGSSDNQSGGMMKITRRNVLRQANSPGVPVDPEEAVIAPYSVERVVDGGVYAQILVESLDVPRLDLEAGALRGRFRKHRRVAVVQEPGILVVRVQHVHRKDGVRKAGRFAVVLGPYVDVEGFEGLIIQRLFQYL